MTTKFKGTPGPYSKDYGNTIGHIKSIANHGDDGTPTIARYDVNTPSLTDDEKEANGRLFAASWDLLEALRPFANYACDENIGDPCDCHNCKARAAIARATT